MKAKQVNYFRQISVLLCAILISTSSLAQPSGEKGPRHDEQVFQQLTGKSYIDRSLVNKGIFFRSAFLPGKIKFESGDSIENIFLRYECLSESLVWLSEGMGQVELEGESIVSFELRNRDTVFLFSKQIVKALNDSTERFYQVFPGSKIGLLALRRVAREDSYTRKKKYYIYAPAPIFILNVRNKEYLLEKPKVKSLIKIFPEKKEEITRQLRQSSGKMKNEDDFISFLTKIEDILIN